MLAMAAAGFCAASGLTGLAGAIPAALGAAAGVVAGEILGGRRVRLWLVLAASGLLNDRVGGASVQPYQPAGPWEEMAFGEGYSGQKYQQSHGEALYRRGMYTLWKRTVPPASLASHPSS